MDAPHSSRRALIRSAATDARRVPSLLVGVFLLTVFASQVDFLEPRVQMGRALVFAHWRAAVYWLSHVLLATPALLLIAHGLGLGRPLDRLASRLARRTARRWWHAAWLFAMIVFTIAVAGREYLLLDQPITDDENAVLFGARMLAEGEFRVPIPEPRAAFPLAFVYEHEGGISSFDFPGVLGVRTLSLVTGLGSTLYALLTALSALAVWDGASRLAGRRAALATAVLWVLSPMLLSLSFTTHAHLASRSFVAIALAAYLRLVVPRFAVSAGWAGLFGVASGLAFLCRPVEAACLLTPAALHLMLVGMHKPRRRIVVAVLGGALPMMVLFGLYNAATTGLWILPARFAPQVLDPWLRDGNVWNRLGVNLGWNLLLLLIWCIGPLGAGLAALGAAGAGGRAARTKTEKARRTAVRSLTAGVALALLSGLLHDDAGIHTVGPIHSSEAAVAIVLLAAAGLATARRGVRALGGSRASAMSLFAGLALSLALFDAVHFQTLREHAKIVRAPIEAVADLRHAVVIADPPQQLWTMRPEMARVRSWVKHLPPPDPFLRDEVLFVYPYVSLEDLVEHLPGREIYRMTYNATGPPITLRPLLARRAPSMTEGRSIE